jgi:hypothetical protein
LTVVVVVGAVVVVVDDIDVVIPALIDVVVSAAAEVVTDGSEPWPEHADTANRTTNQDTRRMRRR